MGYALNITIIAPNHTQSRNQRATIGRQCAQIPTEIICIQFHYSMLSEVPEL